MTVPYYVNEHQSDLRAIKPGWYAVQRNGKLSSGPFPSQEECLTRSTQPRSNFERGAMPGDPKDCRVHALECTRLAETALNKKAQEMFLYFSSTWLKLASQIEVSQALVDKWGGQSRLTHLIQSQANRFAPTPPVPAPVAAP
jgi:hypothetical protein